MLCEESCDIEDLHWRVMATENFTSISGINYILEQIQIENNYLNCDNFVFYIIICIMDQNKCSLGEHTRFLYK